MNNYREISVDEAYRLINHGPLVLVCTVSADGKPDIAPIAWNCPVEKSPARILLAMGNTHQTYKNIEDTGRFVVCVPNSAQADMVRNTGSVSGSDADKYERFNIESMKSEYVGAAVPVGCVGYMECNVVKNIDCEYVALVIGEVVRAFADTEGFEKRVRPESENGRTLHHLGGGEFGVLSQEVDTGQ